MLPKEEIELLRKSLAEMGSTAYRESIICRKVDKFITEIARLNAVIASQEETIHRLNDKLDSVLGGHEND